METGVAEVAFTRKELEARDFAAWAHGLKLQRRNYTGKPYIVHPLAVATALKRVGMATEVVQAGFLHDVIEDTIITPAELLEKFGPRVLELVLMVTNVDKPEDGNRACRFQMNLEHLKRADHEGQSIKLADAADNIPSIVQYDPDFAKVYLPEKMEQLLVCKEGHAELWSSLQEIILDGFQQLKISLV